MNLLHLVRKIILQFLPHQLLFIFNRILSFINIDHSLLDLDNFPLFDQLEYSFVDLKPKHRKPKVDIDLLLQDVVNPNFGPSLPEPRHPIFLYHNLCFVEFSSRVVFL